MRHPRFPQQQQQFASDNYSGICPEAFESMKQANVGHEIPYGDDRWTAEVCDRFRELFEVDCEVFFVFNGTAGNSLALATLCQSYHSILCHQIAHVETDECGAPEFFSHGSKILLVEGDQGKIDPATLDKLITKRTDIHFPKPKVVSITQATELGTLYSPEQLLRIDEICKTHSLKLHMDGARFANAVAALDIAPRKITVDCGVDVLVFGGAKNGLSLGEAVIFFDRQAGEEFDYRCKQAGQLASKMRFMAAQWLGVLQSDAWLRYARHANDCAAEMERRLREIPEIRIKHPREVNSIFVKMPHHILEALQKKGWILYTFIGLGEVRLMCSWDTTEESIAAFIHDLKAALAGDC